MNYKQTDKGGRQISRDNEKNPDRLPSRQSKTEKLDGTTHRSQLTERYKILQVQF